MKHKSVLLLISLVVLSVLFFPAAQAQASLQTENIKTSSAAELRFVVDNAVLLTDDERIELNARLEQIGAACKIDIVVLTERSLNSKSREAFADDYYDYNGYSADGLLILYKDGPAGERDVHISTSGRCIDIFAPNIDFMLDDFISYASCGDFREAFSVFADSCESIMTENISSSAGSGDGIIPSFADSGEDIMISDVPVKPVRRISVKRILIAIVISVVAAFLIMYSFASKLKPVKKKSSASDYELPGSLNITQSRDVFLHRHISKTAKPKNTSSGSSHTSSTHTSSSGHSHGGGGRSF